jgi:hypothetical protein
VNVTVTQQTVELVEVPASNHLRECCEVLNATRERQADLRRFEWLYLQNPDGEAVVWQLRDGKSGEVAGFTAALPRRMWVQGQQRLCWIGSDFSVMPKYRTLGLAIKLRRAARDAIDAGRADFLYAHPNDRMAVIHSRAGHESVGTMIRLARPLRTGSFIAQRTSSAIAGRVAGVLLDPVVRIADSATWSIRHLELRHLGEADFDATFDVLDAATSARSGEIAGFLTFVRDDESLSIKDIFPGSRPDVVRLLVQEARRIGYRSGASSVSMTLLESHPIAQVLRQEQFRPRAEKSQMFAYCPRGRPWERAVMDGGCWRITVGDRDL